ncbi:winged helix-turn-helix transcriptional regulator [Pendulispora brunnea]|uniref:Winged helix-turn-helix transcriptional regulator n=1 Tax=Pendulispora brunnea TaxID=2905690 RepID=A0ABZ2K7H1_9BACT
MHDLEPIGDADFMRERDRAFWPQSKPHVRLFSAQRTTYEAPAVKLDRFDRQLLNLVQEDATQTAERLAEKVGLSPSAIQRRLRRMREEGVIVRDCAVLDPKKARRPTFFVVSSVVKRGLTIPSPEGPDE